ncbi:MBL fold metallo-hydrolase [Terrimonas sp. NA20]|uniref:MBL fold metallo-hydrolase n=1 Tax=Terrimonas ginsenosidimutans TaxID=2908004 RepID=A0ABS9KQD8_9BACT|nr:MBL fold metallo-hydrolase [Terrimonas ginsenosidimutans]MCG2614542.1 MBL fold metallo-hydrolase [Terrimonas ginsenosidimutans]
MKLYSVNNGYFKLDGGAMFGVVPKSIWNKLNPADENNMCSWALRSLLIEEDGRLILVDTGMGDKQDAKFFGHYYLHGDDSLDKSLAKHGFHRDDITDVFLTHLHFDHCGGAIKKEGDTFVPAFKNAVFWSNKEHWKWATEPNDREKASFLKENILPIQESGKLQFIEQLQKPVTKPGWHTIIGKLTELDFTPDISVLLTYGHTSSMMLPKIQYKGRTIVFMADLLPSAAHIPMPYVMAYDTTPLMTLGEKRLFYEEAIAGDYILFFEHDPVNECCTLQQTEKGVRVKEFFKLEDI